MHKLNDLLVFAEVLETGSFSQAAQRLGIAKSSVSKKVSALEKQLGVRLIQRSTRKLRVTDEGRQLYHRCERIKVELLAAEEEMTRSRELPAGTVRISASPLIANTRLAGQMPRFFERYPEVNVELHLSEKQTDLIGEGMDMALRVGELADSSLIAQRLCTVNSVLCASPAYLTGKSKPQEPADIEHHHFLSWQAPGRAAYSQLLFRKGARNYRAKLTSHFVSTDAMSIKEAAINGGGLAVLPDFSIQEDVDNGLLEILLPEYHIHAFPLSLVYPQRQQVTAKGRAVADFIKEVFIDDKS